MHEKQVRLQLFINSVESGPLFWGCRLSFHKIISSGYLTTLTKRPLQTIQQDFIFQVNKLDLRRFSLDLSRDAGDADDMSIRSAIDNISHDQGVLYLQTYFGTEDRPYAGASFDTLGADQSPDNVYTTSDFYALECLEVNVPIDAGLSILGDKAKDISDLLSLIPNRPLASLSEKEFDQYLGANSAALELWRILMKYKGIGITRASKLMARKRPHLIPINDSVIRRVADYTEKQNDWFLWWEALREDEELERRAEELRNAVNRPSLSTLRALDILLWMSGSKKTVHLRNREASFV